LNRNTIWINFDQINRVRYSSFIPFTGFGKFKQNKVVF
jgi:hypothetical protein